MAAEDMIPTSSTDERSVLASLTAPDPRRPADVANVLAALDSTDPATSSWWDWSGDEPIGTRAEVHLGAGFVCTARFPAIWSHARPSELLALGMFASRGAERFPVLLVDAFHDLDQVVEEAREEGFPEPSEVAARNAAALLRQMFTLSSRRYEIYPTPDGEIAIDAPDGHGQSVLVLCSSGGDVTLPGEHERPDIAGPGIPAPRGCRMDSSARRWPIWTGGTIEHGGHCPR